MQQDIILFTVSGSPTMVAKTIEEDDDAVYVEYPFILYREGGNIIASPYMPLAEDGVVAFRKSNLIATSVASKYVSKNYDVLVKELKDYKFKFKKTSDHSDISDLPTEVKPSKILH
jgi:hypothetical protein